MRALILFAAALLVPPGFAHAQAGPTQSRDGLGNAAHPATPSNSLPAGSLNANTEPQSQPAYPSGSSTPNPGAAFVGTRPEPATGALASPSGVLSTTATQGGQTVTQPNSSGFGVGEEGAGRAPPGVR